jgi:DNA processing protein
MAPPPASITVRGAPVEAARAVAVVGSRRACEPALRLARDLASALARAGAVVVSGGAVGIDAAAHEGALSAGRTWAVAGTGHAHCFPAEHASLYERIGEGPGAMIWPFAPEFRHRTGFLTRNHVLVALSDAVVVVQAGERSGALHAASCAKDAGKPLWVVPAAPWMNDFAGSRWLLAQGARPVIEVDEVVSTLVPGGATRSAALLRAPTLSPASLPPEAASVLRATSGSPSHIESIASASGQTVQSAVAALLTLALENVVVEGPPSFFRRTNADKS